LKIPIYLSCKLNKGILLAIKNCEKYHIPLSNAIGRPIINNLEINLLSKLVYLNLYFSPLNKNFFKNIRERKKCTKDPTTPSNEK